MSNRISSFLSLTCILFLFVFIACKNKSKNPDDNIAGSAQELEQKAADLIRIFLEDAISNKGKVDDSTILSQPHLIKMLYEKNKFIPLWSLKGEWQPLGDSLYKTNCRKK